MLMLRLHTYFHPIIELRLRQALFVVAFIAWRLFLLQSYLSGLMRGKRRYALNVASILSSARLPVLSLLWNSSEECTLIGFNHGAN